MSSSSPMLCLDQIQAWVEETEQVISSQASFDTFQPAEVEEIVSRFQAVLGSYLNSQQVAQMVRAVSVLMYVTRNMINMRNQLLNLLQSLLARFLSSSEKDQLSRELNEEVLDLVAQCGEDKEVKMMMLEGLAGQMLAVIANSNLVDWMRRSWLKTFNILLPGSSYKLRELLVREFADDIEQLVDFLYTCGDYDTQSSLVETLLRFTSKADRPQLAMTWFPNYALVQSLFVRINDFETDCRNFLNCFNHGLGDNQLVFTLPALACQVGEQQMFKPPDNKYRQFWVDFNLRPGSISIFHVKEEKSTDLWDLLTITQDMVTSASITTQAGSTVLTLSLPRTQAVLVFTPDPQLLQLVRQLFPHQAAAVKPAKCSRAAEELILPKNCHLPQPVTAALPQAVITSLPWSVETGGKMSMACLPVKVRQAAHHTGQEKELVRYERCSQAQPVRLMAKRKEDIVKTAVQEVIDNSTIANIPTSEQNEEVREGEMEESPEAVEADYRKMKDCFDIKKIRDCCVVIEEGARLKAGEAFHTAKKAVEDEAREKAQAKEKAKAEEEEEKARVATGKKANDEAAALERARLETEENSKLKEEKEAATLAKAEEIRGRAEEEAKVIAEQRAADDEAETTQSMEAKDKAKAERKAKKEARGEKEEEERVKAKEKKRLLVIAERKKAEEQERIKAFEEEERFAAKKKANDEAAALKKAREETEKEQAKLKAEKEASLAKAEEEEKVRVEEAARVAAEKKAVDDTDALERVRLETEMKEKAKLEAEKKALDKAEEDVRARVEMEALEKARVIAEQRAVDEAEKKARMEAAAKEREKVNGKTKEVAKAEREAKKEAIRAKEEEKVKVAERRNQFIADKKALANAAAMDKAEAKTKEDYMLMKADKEAVYKKTNKKKMDNKARINAIGQESFPTAMRMENEEGGFKENRDDFEDMVEIDKSPKQNSDDDPDVETAGQPKETDNVADFSNSQEEKISETPKSWNACPEPEGDYYPASPTPSFTMSGGRRRAKRKLSITKRNSHAMTKAKSIKLSFNSSYNDLSILPTESSAKFNSPPRACSPPPPPSCPSPPSCGYPTTLTLAQQPQKAKKPGRERVSLCPELSHVGEDIDEDVEMEGTDKSQNKVDLVKKVRRSSFKKKLLSNKSLLLEMDVSESSTSEYVNHVPSFKVQAPSYEEVYRRENKRQRDDTKEKMSAKPPASSNIKVKHQNTSGDENSYILPPLIVSRKSNTSDLGSSLMSTSTASSKKFFKTKFRQSLGSSISSWTDSLLSGVKKKRKTYSKTVMKKMTHGAGSQDDPFNTLAISPLVENVSLKAQKPKPVRNSAPSSVPRGKSNRSTKLFSDDEDEMEITRPETSLKKPRSIFTSKKTSAVNNKKGIISKRKPSLSPTTILEEPKSSSLSPLLQQSPPHSFLMQPDQGSAGDVGDQEMGELETVLVCTMRVLEMMARKGKGEAKYREMWGEIRRIAEMEEGRM